MVGRMLVPPAAVNIANGTNDRNCAGLETKSGLSSGAGNALFAAFLLKPETTISGQAVPSNGRKAVKAKHQQANGHPLPDAMAARYRPKLESISNMVDGKGNHKPVPVLSEEQVADIAHYFYLNWLDQRYTAWRTKCATSDEVQKDWLSKRYPNDDLIGAEFEAFGTAYTALVKEQLEAYNSHYMSAIMTFKGKFMGQGAVQRDFMLKSYVQVLEASKELIRLHEGFDKGIAALEGQKKMRLEELERERSECGPMVDKFFQAREELISGWISGKISPFDKFVETLKKIWKIGKVALPVAGTLMMSSHFLSQVKDVVMRIPFVSQITPEIAGAGMVGLWLVVKIGKVALDWHLKIVKSKLAKKAEMRKQEEMAKIAKAVSAANGKHQEALDALRRDFEQGKEDVLSGLRAKYRGLLSEFGYGAREQPACEKLFSPMLAN